MNEEKKEIYRAVFPSGQQKAFFDSLKLDRPTRHQLAASPDVHERTIRDWVRGKFRPPWWALEAICRSLGVEVPAQAEVVPETTLKSIAGKAGGYACFRKYGSLGTPQGRRKGGRVSQQRRRENPEKYSQCWVTRKKIARPERSAELAEFIGIVLGDGGITDYQVTVSLGTETDAEYADFVGELAARLFGIKFGREFRKESKAVNIVLSSVNLVEFLQDQGLKIGNKVAQQVDVPMWVYDNPEYARSCLRGLMDTDGCVFHHRYQVNGKWYEYVKMGFTNHSRPLLAAVEKMLRMFGFHPRHDGVKHIWLDRQSDVHGYFRFVGTRNPKHLRRYQGQVDSS